MTRLLALVLLFLSTTAHAATFNYARTIPNPDPAVPDFFGWAVALTNDTLLVGARFDDPSARANAGAAFAFDLASGALVATFLQPAPAAGDQLGFAVAADGASFVASAPDAALRAGAAFRFARASGTSIRSYATSAAGAKLGYAVAVAANDLLAGAPYEGGVGAAHLFDLGRGADLRVLANPTPDADDLFGRAVAIATANVLAVAAPLDDAPAANAGVVHLFSRDGSLRQTLAAPQPAPGENFGTALAADGPLLAVGAPYADSAGVVYVFDATTGALVKKLTSPEPDARFGAAVAISAGRVLVGAPYVDVGVKDSGAAYVFDLASGTLLDTLQSPAPHAGDQFGAAVALLGNTIAVGAWLDDTGVDNAGAVFQFVDASIPTTSSTSTSSTTSTSTSLTTTTSETSTTSVTSTTVEGPTTTETSTTTTETTLAPESTTTTTVVSSNPSNRTTTTLVTCDSGCEDGDPCNVDTCLEPQHVCTHEPLGVFDGIVCRLDVVDAALHGPPLTGRRLTARLQRKLARARTFVEAARRETSKRTVRRADRALAAFIALVKRSQRTGRLAYAVADELLASSVDAATRLKPLR